MMEILLRFTTPNGSYDVTKDGGIFTFRTPAGTEEYYGCFDEAAQKFDRALEDARREGRCLVIDEGLKGMSPYFAEEQHSDSEEVECKTPDEPARTLPKAPAAAPEEKKPKSSPEVLENPHYAAQRVQPIDLIETLGSSEFVGFLRGNIIKYTARAGKKSGEPAKKEARKALWYALRWYIEVGGSRDDVTAVLSEMEW